MERENRGGLVRGAEWVSEHWIDVAIILVPLLIGVVGIFVTPDATTLLASSPQNQKRLQVAAGISLALLILFFTVLVVPAHIKRLRRMIDITRDLEKARAVKSELEDQLANERGALVQDLESLVDGYLFSLATEKLGFGKQGTYCERITVYSHDPAGGFFRPFGRISLNPGYSKKGRWKYPDSEGIIAKAWADGVAFANDYPDPNKELDRYVDRCLVDGVPREVTRAMAMKPRLLFAHRVVSATGQKPLAVVVVESTEPFRFTEAQLRSLFQSEQSFLSHLVERLAPRLPSPTHAEAAGF